jgi:glycerol-3-phosphate O-acyltransferase/dihydroxyacetone phosphate acyltransferase
MNYFGGHRFRSKMVMEFGHPIVVDAEMVKDYEKNKKEAISKLLVIIEKVIF